MTDQTKAAAEQKSSWTAPTLSFDGALRELVGGGMKPTFVAGEPGDPGSKPPGQVG